MDAGSDDAAREAVVAAVVRWVGPDPTIFGLGLGLGGGTVDVPAPSAELLCPELPGLVLEHLLDPGVRRRTGAHHTPSPVAAGLFEIADRFRERSGPAAPTVCDPAVGGGAFLLAAARALRRQGIAAPIVLSCLFGADLDPLAAATTRAALASWAMAEGVEVDPAWLDDRIVVADGLDPDLEHWPPAPRCGFDIVIGNPPFLSQLAAVTVRDTATRDRLRARFGTAGSGYADSAGLFLVAAMTLARTGGIVAMIQPESLLAARGAAPVRCAVHEAGGLRALWVAAERVFGAGVRVCAPVVAVGQPSSPVSLFRGADFDEVLLAAPASDDGDADGWGALAAAAYGTPAPALATTAGTLGDLATATAGFRDQFYGLVPHVVEATGNATGLDRAPLVTVGSIDPLCCRWGARPVRYAGRRWTRPLVDLASLAEAPGLLGWVTERLRPKVVLATQTRVIEAVVDEDGRFVPSVPVIAVSGDRGDLWAIVAVLLAPPISAWALARAAGTALTADAVKLSARQVLEIPLPVDHVLWKTTAHALSRGEEDGPVGFGAAMCGAYGLATDDPVLAWWRDRLRSWRGEPLEAAGR